MSTYVVRFGGERLDRIARGIFGNEQNGSVKALLDANPGLAAKCAAGMFAPEGTVIFIPAFEPPTKTDGIVLEWE